MESFELHCHVGVGPEVSGEALVTDDNFSARYDLDRIKGIFSRPQHKLAGQSYIDKILVFKTAKGGVASAWMLYEMASRKIAPGLFYLTASILSSPRVAHLLIWHCATASRKAM